MPAPPLPRRLLAEFLGSALLAAVVIGSGIAAQRLSQDTGLRLLENAIDLTGRRPQRLTNELAARADVIVTMGCGDSCPYIPGKRYVDWDLPDPKGRPVEEVRATRDDIARRVDELVAELDRGET